MTPEPTETLLSFMHRDVVTTDTGATLRDLVQTMTAEEVGSVLVTDAGQLVGIVTERDIVVALADGVDLDSVTASDVMSDEPICADVDETVQLSAERMIRAGVLHLPVLRGGRPAGVISARDLLRAFTETAWSELVELPDYELADPA